MSLKQKYLPWLIITVIMITGISSSLITLPTMAQSPLLPAQIEQMIVRQADAWENQDSQAIANDFAEDAIFIAAGFKFVGQEQIKKAAENYFKQFHQTSVNIKQTIIEGDRAAVEWDWRDRDRQTGQKSFAEDAIIFKLAQGKIVYWREYIEKKKQL